MVACFRFSLQASSRCSLWWWRCTICWIFPAGRTAPRFSRWLDAASCGWRRWSMPSSRVWQSPRLLLLEQTETWIRGRLLGHLLRGDFGISDCDVVCALPLRHDGGTQAPILQNVCRHPAGPSPARGQSPPQPPPCLLSCLVCNQLLPGPGPALPKHLTVTIAHLEIVPQRIVNDDGPAIGEGLDRMAHITRHDRD